MTVRQLAERLRQLRMRRGLTQEEFAEIAGISYKFYQQIESGRKKQLWLETVERLAAGFGLEAWQLLGSELPAESKVVCPGETKEGRPRTRGHVIASGLPVQSAEEDLAVAEMPKDRYSVKRGALPKATNKRKEQASRAAGVNPAQ